MNNRIFAVSAPNSLIRKWRSTGQPGTPLVCTWVKVELTKPHSDSATKETGGLLQCA